MPNRHTFPEKAGLPTSFGCLVANQIPGYQIKHVQKTAKKFVAFCFFFSISTYLVKKKMTPKKEMTGFFWFGI